MDWPPKRRHRLFARRARRAFLRRIVGLLERGNAPRSCTVVLCYGLLGLSVVLGLTACSSSNVAGPAAAATVVVPAASAYGSAYAGNNLGQKSSLMAGANPKVYSDIINIPQAQQLSRGYDASGLWVKPTWKYMGTNDGFHFLAYYPSLGLRRIYRLPVSQLALADSFELRAHEWDWRPLDAREFGPQALEKWPVLDLRPGFSPQSTNLFPQEIHLFMPPPGAGALAITNSIKLP